MTDIVERLRDNSPYQGSLIDTAADEIERLRADFNTAKSELQHLADLCKKNLAHWQDALGKLSASQAREAKLRESLDRLKSACQGASYLDCDVIERLHGELAVAHGQIRYLMKDQAVKFDLLAESQAREERLRDLAGDFVSQLMAVAVSNGANSVSMPDELVEAAAFILATHDDTALKERLKAERERCAKYFEDRAERYLQDYAFGADMNYHADLLGYAEAIRNLGDEA